MECTTRRADKKLDNLIIPVVCILFLLVIGFIEFIIDPSFHVMSDAIAALTASLQKQCCHGDDDSTTNDVTVTSPEPSPPPTPPSVGQ